MRLALPAAVASAALMLSVYAEGTRVAVVDHVTDRSLADSPEEEIAEVVDPGPQGEVTLAFAGDVHFERHLGRMLEQPEQGLGRINRSLAEADIAMLNLESSITTRGRPEAKELEDPSNRYHFRTSPAALDVLDAAGVDVVTMANNHGADYGPVGLGDTLRAIGNSPIPVLGIGENSEAAFAPYRVTIGSTDLAFLAADGSMREGRSNVWAAGESNPGLASTHSDRAEALLSRRTRVQPEGRCSRRLHALGSRVPGVSDRPAAHHGQRAQPRRRRRDRRQPRPRAVGIGLAGPELCELWAGQLRLVPQRAS